MREMQNGHLQFCASCVRVVLCGKRRVSYEPDDPPTSLTYHVGIIDKDRDRGVDDGNKVLPVCGLERV